LAKEKHDQLLNKLNDKQKSKSEMTARNIKDTGISGWIFRMINLLGIFATPKHASRLFIC